MIGTGIFVGVVSFNIIRYYLELDKTEIKLKNMIEQMDSKHKMDSHTLKKFIRIFYKYLCKLMKKQKLNKVERLLRIYGNIGSAQNYDIFVIIANLLL